MQVDNDHWITNQYEDRDSIEASPPESPAQQPSEAEAISSVMETQECSESVKSDSECGGSKSVAASVYVEVDVEPTEILPKPPKRLQTARLVSCAEAIGTELDEEANRLREAGRVAERLHQFDDLPKTSKKDPMETMRIRETTVDLINILTVMGQLLQALFQANEDAVTYGDTTLATMITDVSNQILARYQHDLWEYHTSLHSKKNHRQTRSCVLPPSEAI